MASPTALRFHPHLQRNSVQAQLDAQQKNPLAVFNGENVDFFHRGYSVASDFFGSLQAVTKYMLQRSQD
jgi:hypothetical protein